MRLIIGFLVISGIGGCLLLSGCRPDQRTDPLCGDRDALWRSCHRELLQRGFDVGYQNHRQGIIESQPRVSSQWFEFWGRDTATPADGLESSLQTVRRQIRFTITPDPANQTNCCECEVLVERLALSEPVIGGSFRVGDVMQRQGGLSALSYDNPRQRQQYWTNLGTDAALAEDILRSIRQKMTP